MTSQNTDPDAITIYLSSRTEIELGKLLDTHYNDGRVQGNPVFVSMMLHKVVPRPVLKISCTITCNPRYLIAGSIAMSNWK